MIPSLYVVDVCFTMSNSADLMNHTKKTAGAWPAVLLINLYYEVLQRFH